MINKTLERSIREQAVRAAQEFKRVYHKAGQDYKTKYQYMDEFCEEILGDENNEEGTIEALTKQLKTITAQAK